MTDIDRTNLVVTPGHTTRLRGNIGVLGLIFTVVAYNAPIVIMLGYLPVVIGLGNGVGSPVMVLVCGIFIGFLAVGLITVTKRLPTPGGFYSIITAGLGKSIGLAAGLSAVVSYYFAMLAGYGLGGVAMSSLVRDVFHGPSTPWWIWSVPLFAIAAVLGYLRIELSARVLGLFLIMELLFIFVYDAVVLSHGGASGISVDSFRPTEFFSGDVGVGFMFCLGIFGGFEATLIFRDEVKRPDRTIPRATYAVVGILAVAYGFTAWVFINAFGSDAVVAAVNADPTGAATASIKDYLGVFAYDAACTLLLTSSFALILAGHNITARYAFNLSADGILHHSLSRVHHKHLSPHRASIAVSVSAAVGLVILVLGRVQDAVVYARLAGLFAYTLMLLLMLVALAVPAYLYREGVARQHWRTIVLTSISFVFIAFALVLATENFTLIAGSTGWATVLLLAFVYGVVVLGIVLTQVYRRKRPDVYARIGREQLELDHESIA